MPALDVVVVGIGEIGLEDCAGLVAHRPIVKQGSWLVVLSRPGMIVPRAILKVLLLFHIDGWGLRY